MTEIQRATPIEDEAKKTEYNADVFKNEDKRKESAGEIKKTRRIWQGDRRMKKNPLRPLD
jgi:hypothetical protein